MTVNRLNYTGRQKISPSDVTIRLIQRDGQTPLFQADLRLGGYRLPGDAHVFVEAYHQTIRLPFDFGTIDNLKPPDDLTLHEFREAPALARFRLRVTDLTNVRGLLLAEVSGISPRSEEDGESESLLEVKPARLGDVPFRVDFDGERVRLLINSEMPNWRAFSDSAIFKAFSGPVVLREILNRILYVEKESDSNGPRWTSQWLKLAVALPGAPGRPPDVDEDGQTSDDEIDEWVDGVIGAFCRSQHSLEKLMSAWSEERQ